MPLRLPRASTPAAGKASLFVTLSACLRVQPAPQVEKPSYEEFLATCGQEDVYAWIGADQMQGELSEPCADEIAQSLSMKWWSFDEELHAFDSAESPAELVLVGAYGVYSDRVLTAGDLLASGPPEPLATELAALADAQDIRSADPAGALWFALTEAWIDSVTYDPSVQDAGALYQNGEVLVSDLSDDNPGHGTRAPLIYVSGMLVHEASHGFVHPHTDCPDGEPQRCDDDAEGAFGVEAFWTDGWLRTYRDQISEGDCQVLSWTLNDQCDRIAAESRVDFPPCADSASACESP